jgi:hypothetical protein
MEIESVKTWQWMLTGLFIGFLFSCIVSWSGPTFDTQPRDTIEQGEFENGAFSLTRFVQIRGLESQYHEGKPLLRDVTIHPPIPGDPRYWVTGRSYFVGLKPDDPTKPRGPTKVYEEWQPFKYPAVVPYVPGYTLREEKKLDRGNNPVQRNRTVEFAELKKELGGEGSFPTVVEYLKAVAKLPKNEDFKFQFAWWELPVAKWSLPPLAGFMMIGVAWPLALGVLTSFGLTKAPAPVKKAAAPPPAKPVAVKPVVGVKLVAPVPKTPPPPTEDDRQYRGEFYPVAKSTHKE